MKCTGSARAALTKPEEPKDDQHDDDGTDDVDDLMHEIFLCMDGSSDGAREPCEGPAMVGVAGCGVGTLPHILGLAHSGTHVKGLFSRFDRPEPFVESCSITDRRG
jgi:hypothetical protein